MPDSYHPREHDHLVEPMYHALRDREEEQPELAAHSRVPRRDRVRVWVLPLILVGAGALLWLFLA